MESPSKKSIYNEDNIIIEEQVEHDIDPVARKEEHLEFSVEDILCPELNRVGDNGRCCDFECIDIVYVKKDHPEIKKLVDAKVKEAVLSVIHAFINSNRTVELIVQTVEKYVDVKGPIGGDGEDVSIAEWIEYRILE